jgi:hypothetical protein
MADRRNLVEAMTQPVPNVDPELVKSFVTQNRRNERPISTPAIVTESEALKSANHTDIEDQTTGSKKNRFKPVGLIPVTIRLRPEIAGALKRASLERELEGEEVFTQQDLVEQALEPWLRTNGYVG